MLRSAHGAALELPGLYLDYENRSCCKIVRKDNFQFNKAQVAESCRSVAKKSSALGQELSRTLDQAQHLGIIRKFLPQLAHSASMLYLNSVDDLHGQGGDIS